MTQFIDFFFLLLITAIKMTIAVAAIAVYLPCTLAMTAMGTGDVEVSALWMYARIQFILEQ